MSILGPIRPPSEAYSLLIRVTEGCPWNRCEFCSTFKNYKFAVRKFEDVRNDIIANRELFNEVQRVAKQTGCSAGAIAKANGILWIENDGVKSVFLQDSDAVSTKTEHLVAVLNSLRESFPYIQRICSYSRGKTIFRKTSDDLTKLREAGLSRIHIGLETGDDDLMEYIQKGATAKEMVVAGQKAVAAGFEVSEYVIPGLGGRERWKQHAINSARVLNQINPRFIRLRSFHAIPGTPMYEKAQKGEYSLQTVEGILQEIRHFVEELDVTSELVISDYAWNYYIGEADGKLPNEKQVILNKIDAAINNWRTQATRERNLS